MEPDDPVEASQPVSARPSEDWWEPVIRYHDEIAFEIGQVAIRSAECETCVREVLADLAGDNGRNWIMFEGQGLSGMIDNIKSMLSIEHDEYWLEIRQALEEIKKLFDLRNAVIHGTWLHLSEWDEDELGAPGPGPWGDGTDDDGESVWLCTRSRLRKLGHPSKWSIGDIETLGYKIERAAERLMVAYARFHRGEASAERFEQSGWSLWLRETVGPQGGIIPRRS